MKTIVGESNWLGLRRRRRVIEQTVPRFDRCAMPGLGGCGSWVLDVHRQRFGIALIGTGLGRPDVAGPRRWGSAHGRQRVFDVVVVIVETIPEAVVMADAVVVGNVV